MRTRTYPVSLTHWFPSDDPIAIAIAKLCVLREDYFLELQGIVTPGAGPLEGGTTGRGIPELDENSASFRRQYFFRNSMRTLDELRNLVERMHTHPPDKKALAKEPRILVDGFKKLREQLGPTSKLIKNLRDSVGGHVLHSGLENILRGLDPDMNGFFQEGEIRGKTRYKFTNELVLSMILDKVESQNKEEKIEMLLSSTAQLVFIIEVIDQLIRAYIVDRKLLAM